MKITWYTSAFVTFRLVTSFRFTKTHYENKTGSNFVVVILPFLEVTFIDCKLAKKILVAEFFDNQSYIENIAYYDEIKEEKQKAEIERLEKKNQELWKKKTEVESELSTVKSAIKYSRDNIKELYELSLKIESQ